MLIAPGESTPTKNPHAAAQANESAGEAKSAAPTYAAALKSAASAGANTGRSPLLRRKKTNAAPPAPSSRQNRTPEKSRSFRKAKPSVK